MKTCNVSTCSEVNPQPLTNFHSSPSCKDYTRKQCKSCMKKIFAAYYLEHKEKILSQVEAWQAANPEKVAQYARKQKVKNKDVMRAQSKAYYQRNKEELNRKAKDKYRKKKLEKES